jgi:hypothetical protein
MNVNKCLMCESLRSSSSILCSVCHPLYSPYVDTDWFKELVRLQKRQYYIDRLESTDYTDLFFASSLQTQYGSSRQRGRPRHPETIEAYIRAIYNPSFSIRYITKLCYSHGLTVSRETVRSIVNKIKADK